MEAKTGMVQIERIKCGIGNCYIVSQGDSAILVDTAKPAYRRRILRRCEGKNIRLIAITHGHCDHAQNAAFLSRAWGAPVAMHPEDIPLVRDIAHEPFQAATVPGRIVVAGQRVSLLPGVRRLFDLLIYKTEPFEVSVELREGFSFARYGVDARIVALPGHTRGSVGIVAGDGLMAGSALNNFFFPAKPMLFGHRETMEESARKISGMGDLTIYFGHGKPVKNRVW